MATQPSPWPVLIGGAVVGVAIAAFLSAAKDAPASRGRLKAEPLPARGGPRNLTAGGQRPRRRKPRRAR